MAATNALRLPRNDSRMTESYVVQLHTPSARNIRPARASDGAGWTEDLMSSIASNTLPNEQSTAHSSDLLSQHVVT